MLEIQKEHNSLERVNDMDIHKKIRKNEVYIDSLFERIKALTSNELEKNETLSDIQIITHNTNQMILSINRKDKLDIEYSSIRAMCHCLKILIQIRDNEKNDKKNNEKG